MLKLLIPKASSLICLELEAEVTECIVDVDSLDTKRLALSNVVHKEASSVKDSLIEDRSLYDSLVAFFNELMDQLVGLVDLS